MWLTIRAATESVAVRIVRFNFRHPELVSGSYFFNPSEIKTLKQVQGDGCERKSCDGGKLPGSKKP